MSGFRRRFSFTQLLVFVAMGLCLIPSPSVAQEASEFQSLFDGKTLEGWKGDANLWSVVDGAITGTTTADTKLKKNSFLVWDGKVSNFDLRLKVKLVGGNTGIQFRSQVTNEKTPFSIKGYQADLDAKNRYSGINYDERGRGIIAPRGKRSVIGTDGKSKVVGDLGTAEQLVEVIKKDDWNDYRIVAVGNRIRQYINGVQTIDLTDNDEKNRDMEGLLALQVHVGPPMTVSYKDLQLKVLGADADIDQITAASTPKTHKIVFIAGKGSHGYGAHEHYAGSVLLAKRLEAAFPELDAEVIRDGWPSDPETVFADVDSIVMYADGGKRHPALPHLEEVDKLMQSGVGLVCLHYGVEVPKDKAGQQFLDWIGGYFEAHWSVNPHWVAKFETLPEHPITRGVKPFEMDDEWYFHMRFREDMEGVTPILSAVAPESTMRRADGPHSGNPTVRKSVADGDLQHVAWCAERPNGGRGFGLTGGHYHENWGNENLRRLVLNAIAWTAKVEVPEGGIGNPGVTTHELEENQDFPKSKKKKKKKNKK